MKRSARPCGCVLRAVWRTCYRRYQTSQDAGPVTMGVRGTYHRRNEDYRCDFLLLARRTLDATMFRVFDLHFLTGADWKVCCAILRIDRGTFFHDVYYIEQSLGAAFANTAPYGLWPIAAYFGRYRSTPCAEEWADGVHRPQYDAIADSTTGSAWDHGVLKYETPPALNTKLFGARLWKKRISKPVVLIRRDRRAA